jgi:hypothetical protein
LWWEELGQAVQNVQGAEVVLCIDSNAHIKHRIENCIGAALADEENEPARHFTDMLSTRNMFAPSTFEEFNDNIQEPTSYVNEVGHVIDFVCVANKHKHQIQQGGVMLNVDVSTKKIDHRPVMIELTWKQDVDFKVPWSKSRICDIKKLQDPQIREQVAKDIEEMKGVPWQVDSHTHAHILENQIKDVLTNRCPIDPAPKKPHVGEQAWKILCEKKEELKRQRRLTQEIKMWEQDEENAGEDQERKGRRQRKEGRKRTTKGRQ